MKGTVYHGEKPFPDRSVSLMGRFGRSSSIERGARTLEDGTYRFDTLPSGQFGITAWGPAPNQVQLKQWATVKDGEAAVIDFHFATKTATVEGLVTLEGEPLKGAKLTLYIETDAGPETFIGEVKSDGWYRLEDVPAGQAVLIVRDRFSALSKRVEFGIGENEVVRQDVEFSEGALIVGEVSGLRAGESLSVFLFRGEIEFTPATFGRVLGEHIKEHISWISLSENGSYGLPGLNAGRYTVCAVVSTGAGDIGSPAHFIVSYVELAEDATYELDLVFD